MVYVWEILEFVYFENYNLPQKKKKKLLPMQMEQENITSKEIEFTILIIIVTI